MLERIYTPMFMSSIFRKINAVDKKKSSELKDVNSNGCPRMCHVRYLTRHILGATNIGCPSFRIDHS